MVKIIIITFVVWGGYLLAGYGHPADSSNYSGSSNSSEPNTNDNDAILTDISMGYIYGPSTGMNDTRPVANGGAVGLIRNKWFDFRKPTVCYFHGFGDRPNNIFVQSMAQAFLRRGGWNFLFLDWSTITFHPGDVTFFANTAAPDSVLLAPHLAKLFIQWFNAGLCDKTFHLIGHSLGGELAGMVANLVKVQSNHAYFLGRLSALDPASPLFFGPGALYRHVTKNDAKFVDVYHTNPTVEGAPIPCGVVDFWFNNPNEIQPGCDIVGNTDTQKNTCSHVRAIYLFVESVLAQLIYEFFYCIKANSWDDFVAGRVDYSDVTVAGMDTPNDARGSYYCTTSNTSHYTNALRGIGYNPPGV